MWYRNLTAEHLSLLRHPLARSRADTPLGLWLWEAECPQTSSTFPLWPGHALAGVKGELSQGVCPLQPLAPLPTKTSAWPGTMGGCMWLQMLMDCYQMGSSQEERYYSLKNMVVCFFFFSNSLKIILKPFEIVYYNRNVGANTNFLQSIFLRMIKFWIMIKKTSRPVFS